MNNQNLAEINQKAFVNLKELCLILGRSDHFVRPLIIKNIIPHVGVRMFSIPREIAIQKFTEYILNESKKEA